MDIREMLLKTKLFSSLEGVVDIVAQSEQRKIAPHTFLIKKGPILENEFYFLIDGILEVVSPKGVVINTLHPGIFVGESVVFSEKERIASIKTKVESTVLMIPVNLINELAESLLISLSILAAAFVAKMFFIHFTSTTYQAQFFQTLRDKILPNNLLVKGESTLFFDTPYAIGIFFPEILVRGGLQGMFKKFFTSKYRGIFSIALTSLIFSSAHSYFGGDVVFAVFLTSLFWGWLYNRQRNIFGVILSHEILGLSILANNWWLERRLLDG